MSTKEIIERLDRIEKLLLNGAVAGGDRVPADGSYEAKPGHATEREWTVHSIVVAKLRTDGALELSDGPHVGLWTVVPGTTNPLTTRDIEQLAKEAVSYAQQRWERR